MKLILSFLLITLVFTFSDTNAQKYDSTISTPLMKRQSKIFVARIQTQGGTQKGILYEADSSGIVILDSLYQRVRISLSEIKSLKIYRSNAVLYGAKIGFLIPTVPLTAIGLVFWISGNISLGGIDGLVFFISYPITGMIIGVGVGIILAIANSIIPIININLVKHPDKYHRQLKYIKLKTQEVLIKKYPKKVRLV